MSISAMRQALDALESIKVTVSTSIQANVIDGVDLFPKEIVALRQAIAEAEKQEFECPRCGHCCREWVGLTDEEISNLFFDGDSSLGVKTMSASDVWRIKMTENLLREKNVPQP